MLVIDGAHLEGGGQVVRASAALSALTGTPVRIEHIREGRERPGLRPQHMTAIRAVAALCDAVVEGCVPGSRELEFHPGSLSKSRVCLDVGTAGSIALVLQAWLPLAVRVGGEITLTGGTEVRRSPTIDYIARILLPFLKLHGARISLEILARGYYPVGGGMVRVKAEATGLECLSPDCTRQDEVRGVCSCSAGLPPQVVARQAETAATILSGHFGLPFPVSTDVRSGPGTGSSCTVWTGWMGGTGIGRRGYPAEKVGGDAAGALLNEVTQGGLVDSHLADQLLIYLPFAGGSYTASRCTLHARTMCWLLEQFGFPVDIREEGVTRFACAKGA